MIGVGGVNSINGNVGIVICIIFKVDWIRECGSYFLMDLVFGGMCVNCFLIDQIGNKLVGDYIKKFCGGWYFQFVYL